MNDEIENYKKKIVYLQKRLRSEKHTLSDHIASLIKENERVHSTFQGEFSEKLSQLTTSIEELSKTIKSLQWDFEREITEIKKNTK